MIHYQKTNRTLWFIIALLTIVASVNGLIFPEIYQPFVKPAQLPGLVSQDLMSLIAALALFLFSFFSRSIDARKLVIAVGILGYLFYAYGIYVIEQFYTVWYFLYMGIFGLSFYTIFTGILAIDSSLWINIRVSRKVHIISAIFLLLIPFIFYPLWIMQIVPLIRESQRAGVFYSIYILDLCFILPAMIVIAIMSLKNRGWAILFQPALLFWGGMLLFSVALGGFIHWIQEHTINMKETTFYFVLSMVFLRLTVMYFRKLQFND